MTTNKLSFSDISAIVFICFVILSFSFALSFFAVNVYNTFQLDTSIFKGFEQDIYKEKSAASVFSMGLTIGLTAILLITFKPSSEGHIVELVFRKVFKYLLVGIAVIMGSSFIYFSSTYNQYTVLDSIAHKKYDYAMEHNVKFKDSDIGIAYKNKMDAKDYIGLANLFKDDKDLLGLSDNDVFDKMLIVQSITSPQIKNEFNNIYKDQYITFSEYDKFKETAIAVMAGAISSASQSTSTDNLNDSRLLSKLWIILSL